MRRIGSWSLLGSVVLLLGLGSIGTVAGQESEAETPAFRGSMGAMLGGGLPNAYFAPECSDGSALGLFAAASRTFSSWVAASLGVQYVRDLGVGNCASARPRPPAPYTAEEVESEGSSAWAPMVSLYVGPEFGSGRVAARAVARVGVRSGLEQEAVVALGGEVQLGGRHGTRFVIGLDQWITDVAVRRILIQEEGGEVVLRDTRLESRTGDFAVVRLGLSFPLR